MNPGGRRLDEVPWHLLTPELQTMREFALDALKEMRRPGHPPLNEITLPLGITEPQVIEHLGHALRRVCNTYIAKPRDHISRGLNIIEKDVGLTPIEVNDSDEASKAGEYRYYTGRFADTGNTSYLDLITHESIRDSKGVEHFFEMDPDLILEALKRYEGGFYDVYT